MSYNFGFVMDQIAGHITNYRNLRSVAERIPDIQATWHEIHYYKKGGVIEQVREKLPFIPTYATGIMRGTWEVRKALRGTHYDAWMTNASVHPFFSRALRRRPSLLDFDSTPRQIDRMPAYGNGADDPKPVAALKWRLTRNAMHSATLLQAWSSWARQSAIDEYGVAPDKVVVNPPGVDLNFWKPASPTAQRTGGVRRILFVGGDFKRKGGQLLLDWYASQDPQHYELHLVTRDPVEIRPGIFVYHDMQPNTARLLNLYQNSDLFVLPSLGECFGIATIEAMGAGLPVIASDVGGTADIIEPGRNGYIIPSNDTKALHEAISAILENEERRQTMARQSRILAEQRFDLETNARRTLNYLKELATRPVPLQVLESPERV